MQYVYILICVNGTSYVGCTNDLKDRVHRHSLGQVTATKPVLPVRLVAYFAFSNKYTAFKFEKYLKTGSGRAFIARHELTFD